MSLSLSPFLFFPFLSISPFFFFFFFLRRRVDLGPPVLPPGFAPGCPGAGLISKLGGLETNFVVKVTYRS